MGSFKTYLNEKVLKVDVKFIKPTLEKIKSKIIGKNLGNLEIEQILNKAFSKYYIRFERSSDLSNDRQAQEIGLIGGSIISDFKTIKIYYAEDLYQTFDDEYYWEQFIEVSTKIIEHELVHREQFNKIKDKNILFKLTPETNSIDEYLSNKFELMAFAKKAVTEFLNLGYSKDQVLSLLKNPMRHSSPDRTESNTFWTYTEWFEINDKEFKKFIKYMVGYLTL